MEVHIVSYPTFFNDEVNIISSILQRYNVIIHLRKPKADDADFEQFIKQIPSHLLPKIILHSAHYLINHYNIGGLHFSTKKRSLANNFPKGVFKSTSCHSISEIEEVKHEFDACFISPLFPSISKQGYKGHINFKQLKEYVAVNKDIQVIGLGGISNKTIPSLIDTGINSVAILGYLWGKNPNPDLDYHFKLNKLINQSERPYCLSIAGFDPSSGAGVLADIKTFESNYCYGLGVNTAITYQNDHTFEGVKWLMLDEIKQQIEPLSSYPVKAIKIGLIENMDVLIKVVDYVRLKFPMAKLIWDPILKSSSGFEFHSTSQLPNNFYNAFDLITPNKDEYDQLQTFFENYENAYLLKGGHSTSNKGTDQLICKAETINIEGKTFDHNTNKHGTGCVLSSAISAHLAKDYSLKAACLKGKKYVEQFMLSNKGNLGYHT